MKSVFPQDWADLLDRILADLNGPLFEKLYQFYWKSSGAEARPKCDDTQCRKEFVCKFKQARPDDLIDC
jgi:hypothetical protein